MNVCHFLGNLVRDPDLRATPGGKNVVNFDIAVNKPVKKGGKKEVAFLRCEAWDSGAELIHKYFQKGDPIIVHCSIRQENWDDKTTGAKRSALVFRVNNFEFVPGAKSRAADTDAQEPEDAPRTNSRTEDDDIPF